MKKFSEIVVRNRRLIFVLYAIAVIIAVFGIFKANVNYDMSKYLPNDSEVKKGMEIMTDEFGEGSSLTVMFECLDETERLQRKEELSQFDHVLAVAYDPNDPAYQKDGCSKYMINVSTDTYAEESRETLADIKERYGDDAYVCGPVVNNDMTVDSLGQDLPEIFVIAAIVIFAILFILCDSWLEPVIFMGCIGVAIVLNMGANALLPSISFMTFSIGALLQLGLSMDYSIMLINRYDQEKKRRSSHEEAMISALANSFAPVSGSSVTTIVGLLALAFMKFKIGRDMGVVLAKGVFMSLVCIFTLLPGAVVSLDKYIEKSRKKSLTIPMSRVMRGVARFGAAILPATAVLVGTAFATKGNVKLGFVKTFDNKDQTYIEERFGLDNQAVLLYKKNESPEKVAAYIKWLEARPDVNSVQDYSNTLGIEYTPAEIAAQFGAEESQVSALFQAMGKETMSVPDFLEVAAIALKRTGGDEETLARIAAAQETVKENAKQMSGKEYNRMVLSLKHEAEGDAVFSAVGEIEEEADAKFGDTHYFVGDSIMAKEMNDGFRKELNFVTILTVIAIFVVVLFTFRSVVASAILVIVIQSAVYVATFCMAQSGFTVNYVSLILVQCILMGATIDYGILFICNYMEERGSKDKKQALCDAMNRSVKTILTSSLILMGCCLTTGLIMTEKSISQTTILLAVGTAISVLMVVFALPAAIYFADKLAIKRFGGKK